MRFSISKCKVLDMWALLTVHQYAKVPFHQAAFQPLLPKLVGLPEVVVTKMQDLTVGPIEIHTVNLGP